MLNRLSIMVSIDLCVEFPKSKYGGASKYSKDTIDMSYPSGTEATLFCGDQYLPADPSTATCLPGGKWTSTRCKPKPSENVPEVTVGPEAGETDLKSV